MKKSGFTLTEIIIVVAILGILASLAIPRLFPQTERARASEAINILSAIRQGQEAYRLTRGVYLPIGAGATNDALWARIGLEDPNDSATRFFDYQVTTGAGNATFAARATRRGGVPAGSTYAGQFGLTNTGVFCNGAPIYSFAPETGTTC